MSMQAQAQAQAHHHHQHHQQALRNRTSLQQIQIQQHQQQQLQHQQPQTLTQGVPSNSMSTSYMPIRTGATTTNGSGSGINTNGSGLPVNLSTTPTTTTTFGNNFNNSSNPNSNIIKTNPFGSGLFGNGITSSSSVSTSSVGGTFGASGSGSSRQGTGTASPAMPSFSGTPPLRGTPTLGGGGVGIGVGIGVGVGGSRVSPGGSSTRNGNGVARASSPGVLSRVPESLSTNNHSGGGIMNGNGTSRVGSSGGAGGGILADQPTNFVSTVGGNHSTSTSTTSGSGAGANANEETDQVHASVSHLLSRAYSLPCSTAAQAFTQLVQPTARFQLALDALLPLLDSVGTVELAQRILVSFILYSLYAPHPIAINPFRSVLFVAYVKERGKAIQVTDEGGTSPNEQLVWVLWKILKGDGNDIGPYSPSTLARSPLPPKLRAVNLVLDDEMYYSGTDLDDLTYTYFQKQQSNYGQPATSGYSNNTYGNTAAVITSPTGTSTSSSGHSSAIIAGIGSSFSHSPLGTSPIGITEEERRNERVIQGMRLLLAARERVLTLAEQRVLFPLINDVTSSRLITSLDITPLIAKNPIIAHPLFVGLLTNNSSSFTTSSPTANNSNISQFLDVLPFLPPTLPSMDLMGRLLRDQTIINVTVNPRGGFDGQGGGVEGYSTVGDLVRMEVLGRFIHECINWIERAEREERDGLVSDDRLVKGVQNLCRFFNSLIKLQIVDLSSDTDAAEMMHFTLRYAKFEDANVLYRLLALSRY